MQQEQVTVYREGDGDVAALAGRAVAVVGYGNLGRSLALNFRDSGLDVVVGNVDDEYRARARDEGFTVRGIGDAVAGAEVVLVLLPDEVIPDCFAAEVAPCLRAGAAVCFASGYALAYGLVHPPPGVDVLLLAPRMPGAEVRRCYLQGEGFVSYVSVERDASGEALRRLLALAQAAGSLRRGALRLSAAQEALIDLFVEQSVGPYLGAAFQLAFQVGVEAGLPPEAMVLELYLSGEMARTIQGFAEEGFFRAVAGHGLTAAYGGFLRSLDLDREAMAARFRAIAADIASGGFARKLQEEQAAGFPARAALAALIAGGDPLTQAERRARAALGLPQPPQGPAEPARGPDRG